MEVAEKTELAVVVEQSGIEKSKGEIISKTLGEFFRKAKEWNATIESLVINDISETGKMKMAKEGRLSLKNQRLAAKKLVDDARVAVKSKMADYVLEDKLWLKSFQMIEATFKNLESKLHEKEKYAERKEAERLAEIERGRIHELMPYNEFCQIEFMDLKGMSDEDFKTQFDKAKKMFDLDKAEKERIENERIAKEKAESKERERVRLENEKLKQEAEERELEVEKKRITTEKREKELRPYIVFIRDYSGLMSKNEAEYNKEFADIKKGAEDHWEFERKKVIQDQAKEDDAKKKQNDEKAALEAKIKKQKEVEENRIAEAKKVKQEAEETQRQDSLAPQKIKITKWVNSFEVPVFDNTGLDKAANEKVAEIISKFSAFKKWAVKQSELIK